MFEEERNVFRAMKETLSADAVIRREVEDAFQRLLGDYSTKIRENRFVVGGAAEVIVCAAIRATGIQATDNTLSSTGGDISLPSGCQLSLKGVFSRSVSSIRIVNVLGASTDAAWNHATIFMVSGRGLLYADPELLPDCASRKSDAVVLPYKALRQFADSHKEWTIDLEVPFSLQDESKSRLTSRTVAFEILRGLPRLRQSMPTNEG